MNQLNYAGRWLALAALAGVLGACSTPERSRALDQPRVGAATIAMQVCANCHGVGGVSQSPAFPHLAGQTPSYLTAQLKAFKSHGRSTDNGQAYMWGMSAQLSDEQIAGLARYFASQGAAPGQAAQPALEEAKAIYLNGVAANNTPACAACHGAHGEGMQDFPRLAGQHADYTFKQLLIYQQGNQRPDGAVMKGMLQGLSEQRLKELAMYLEGLPRS